MSLVAGSHLGPYEIVTLLGAGGMGEVYRARDSRLGRDVALKVLPATMAADPDRIERFQREARAIAALNHPHIVTIYSVEETNAEDRERTGVTSFLTMELVEGQSLDQLIPPAGLAPDRVIAMALSLAEALVAAHDKGIVHRDLKPTNIIVTADGRVKVLDFGLAKELHAVESTTETVTKLGQTGAGVVLGTPAYMSPEQIGGRPIDARTDIFSFGVVVHEMASGTRPFQGANPATMASAILRDPAPSLVSLRRDAPIDLDRLLSRCLEKDRERRIQTARDVRNELDVMRRTLESGSGPRRTEAIARGERTSIVVVPFANLSPDPENEYFSDGLTEELISDLSKVKALSVLSRTSAMQLKGAKKDVRTIGRELGVRFVLDGSVRKAGNSLRITAQLIDASTDAQVWSEKYSGTMDDVFEVQERVSREIVRALNITLTADEQGRLSERPIGDARAFELYLQARLELRRYALDRAVTLLNEAVRIEGETPPLMAALTWAKVWRVRMGLAGGRGLLDEAEREARAIQARAPDIAYGESLLGHIAYERGQLPEAVHHLKRAVEMNPNDSDALMMLTMTYSGAGQDGPAREVARRAVVCDPLSALSWMANGAPRWFVGQPEQSIASLEHAVEVDPHNFIAHWTMAYGYVLVGRLIDAGRHARILQGMGPDLPYTRQVLSLIDGIEGRQEAALAQLAPIDTAMLDAHNQFHLAESFIMAGQPDRGLDLLEESVSGFYPYPYLAEYCPFLKPVRSTPRFAAALAKARGNYDAFASREAELMMQEGGSSAPQRR
ncbi:MAG: protein kinase [Vicinamibacterales bacterium]